MKRILLMPVFTFVLAAFAWGGDTAAQVSPQEQSRLFGRNRKLIEELVGRSLQLSREDDSLKRAEFCNATAKELADELRDAARAGDGARAAELGLHLRSLLAGGVAGNLKAADQDIPMGSSREEDLFKIRDHTMEFIRPLEEEIGKAAASKPAGSEMYAALRAVSDGRTEVERSLKKRSRSMDKDE